MSTRYYVAFIHKDPDSAFGAFFPSFPGCFSSGSTLEEVHKMAREAAQLYVDSMVQGGTGVPLPSSIEDIDRVRNEEGPDFMFLIPVQVPE